MLDSILNNVVVDIKVMFIGQFLGNLTEVPLPVRFLFLLMGPPIASLDYHEVGRSISTLMANPVSGVSIVLYIHVPSIYVCLSLKIIDESKV